jgi:predicted amidohydrolase
MNVEIGNVASNREKIIERFASAVQGSAEFVIFPECALTGYCFDSLEEASAYGETIDGPTAKALARVCRETGAYVIVGFIERDGQEFYNSAMVVGPEGVAGTYRKAHLPFLGVDRFLTPGNRPFAIFDLAVGKIGVLICYDSSFPEASRALKLMGAEMIVLPTNWPPGAWRNPEFVINTRALENHVNFVAVNRVGTERGWQFIGRSKVVDYNGDTTGEAGGEDEEILFSQVDLRGSNNNRIVNVAGSYEIDRLDDRRPELYDIITSIESKTRHAR